MKKTIFPQLCGGLQETSWLYHYMSHVYPEDAFVIIKIEDSFYAIHKKEQAESDKWTSFTDPISLEQLQDDPNHESIHWQGIKHEFWKKLECAFDAMGLTMCEFLLTSEFPIAKSLTAFVEYHKTTES